MKKAPVNKYKKQPTAEDILKEVLDESGNKVAGESFDTFPEVAKQKPFEQKGNDTNLFNTAPSKREQDKSPNGFKESASKPIK